MKVLMILASSLLFSSAGEPVIIPLGGGGEGLVLILGPEGLTTAEDGSEARPVTVAGRLTGTLGNCPVVSTATDVGCSGVMADIRVKLRKLTFFDGRWVPGGDGEMVDLRILCPWAELLDGEADAPVGTLTGSSGTFLGPGASVVEG